MKKLYRVVLYRNDFSKKQREKLSKNVTDLGEVFEWRNGQVLYSSNDYSKAKFYFDDEYEFMDWRFDRENDDIYLSVWSARIVETNADIFEGNLGKTIDESGF